MDKAGAGINRHEPVQCAPRKFLKNIGCRILYIPGQRWMSEAEPDIGLGSIIEIDERTVQVSFAASGESRTYALRSAPLSRVYFSAEETIEDQNGQMLLVIDVDEEDGLLTYQCEDAMGETVILPEQELNDRLRLNRPQDKLLSRRIDSDVWFSLRYETWLKSAANWRSPVFGLSGPRVDLIPHQLFIASEVASRQAPRVLLADEVGLGKTIEAGLIMHRLMLSDRVKRVLIVVPEALLYQWLVEMLRRFNLHFSIYDTDRFVNSDDKNPFHGEQRVLCSLEFLTSSPEVARAALGGDWDLLVVDEAHHLEWSEEAASLEYELVEALAGMTPGVLLLTATPEQLGRAGHFARLRLLDPQRFHNFQEFITEEKSYEPVAELAVRVVEDEDLSADDQRQLASLVGDMDISNREEVINRLVDRHGTGRVLLRNTRQAIKGFPGREAYGYPLPLPDDYKKNIADITPETNYPRKWSRVDPRVDWLVDKLRELSPEKVLVICAHAKTVIKLKEHLLEKEAIHVALFHEGMEIVERDRAAVFFADTEEGSQALICSEIGSEGRNFQFAHHLILFDLPLVPDLLEQRIGRLDRIGQKHTIQIHVPYMQGAASEVLFNWYDNGLNAFTAICPAASAVYAQLGERLQQTLHKPAGMNTLVKDGNALTSQINQSLEQGRDRLLELHSHRPEVSAELVRQIRSSADDSEIKSYMTRFWDAYGVHHHGGRGQSEVVRPGSHMRHDHFPGLPYDGVTVTWQRDDALVHEDREFMTWEHPMVRGAMELLTSAELGSSAVTVCSLEGYKTGTLFLELLYVTECAAPATLEAERYLPPTCLRLLLDVKGANHAESIPHEKLKGLCLTQNKKLAETVIKSQSDKLKLLFKLGDQMAESGSEASVTESLVRMQSELDREQTRLLALAEINPNVREDEIEQVETRRELLEVHLKDTRVRLDAARVVVMR